MTEVTRSRHSGTFSTVSIVRVCNESDQREISREYSFEICEKVSETIWGRRYSGQRMSRRTYHLLLSALLFSAFQLLTVWQQILLLSTPHYPVLPNWGLEMCTSMPLCHYQLALDFDEIDREGRSISLWEQNKDTDSKLPGNNSQSTPDMTTR